MMKDNEIDNLAQQIAHEHSAACRNRPGIYKDMGHGKACKNLARAIADAMLRARDSVRADPNLRAPIAP